MELLISFAHPDFQAGCLEHEQVYSTELATIGCGPDDLPFTYTLFSSIADMGTAYNGDLDRGETPPQPDGTCSEANFEDTYQIDGQDAGRINCREHHSSSTGELYRVMEWTNDELLVLGYISNRADLHTWDELITFWQDEAGPFLPE